MRTSSHRPKKKQQGIVLLMLVIVLALLASSYYFSTISVVEIRAERNLNTQKALKQAKQALLAYAATYNDVKSPGDFGFLPCPDYNNGLSEGLEDSGNCGSQSVSKLGYLPWRTLGIAPLKDDSGSCLMYAVTGEYKNDEAAIPKKAAMLNEDSYGMFQVVNPAGAVIAGAAPGDRIVAIVFAPGEEQSYQSRNFTAGSICGRDYGNYSAWLDTVGGTNNAVLSTAPDSIDRFVHMRSGSETVNNDRFLTISREELWHAIMQRKEMDASVVTGESLARRVTEALARCMAQYANDNNNNRLPWAAPLNLGGADFRFNNSYDDASSPATYFGRYPYVVDDSDAVIPGTGAPDELFEKNFTPPPATMFSCDDLPIAFPAGPNADLRSPASGDRRFWQNRKDQFFYAVSRAYRPQSMGSPGAPKCGSCITVGGTRYAAVVMYSGAALAGQTRDFPVAASDTVDSKSNAGNYIEVVNPAGNGTGDYTPTANDVMFCITDTAPLDVVPCS